MSELDDILREAAERKRAREAAAAVVEAPAEETSLPSAEEEILPVEETAVEETAAEEVPAEETAETETESPAAAAEVSAEEAAPRGSWFSRLGEKLAVLFRSPAEEEEPEAAPAEEAAAERIRRIAAAAQDSIRRQVAEEVAAIDAELDGADEVPPEEETPVSEEEISPEAEETVPEATRVVDLPEEPARPAPPPPEEPEDDQLTLTGFGEEPPDEELAAAQREILETGESSSDWEERLRRTREEQIASFRRQRESGAAGAFRLVGEEEEEEVDEAPDADVSAADEGVEEYSDPGDAETVRSELHYQRVNGWLSLTLAAVVEVILLVINIVAAGSPNGMAPSLYVTLNLVLLGVLAVLGRRPLIRGFRALFAGKPNADSPLAVVMTLITVYTLLCFIPGILEGCRMQIPTPLGGLALLFGAFGRQLWVLRTAENFSLLGNRGRMFRVARRVENKATAEEIGRAAVPVGDPAVAFFKETDFPTRYLQSSVASDPADAVAGKLMIAAGALALLTVLLFGWICRGWSMALYLAVCVFCLALPALQTTCNLPLYRAARHLVRQGSLLNSWLAVEQFGDLDGVAVSADDIFPDTCVELRGMQVFRGNRIDEAILNAAAVLHAAEGPLAGLFDNVIEHRSEILPAVENIVCEQGMGVSGWINGRRIFVGNRRLMENHGITPPSLDFEQRHTADGCLAVYMAAAGDMAAMFLVRYIADEAVGESLRRLCREGITLLIRTTDPNITETMLCDAFGLDSYYVELLGHNAGNLLNDLQEHEVMDCPAVLATTGGPEQPFKVVASASRLGRIARFTLAAQIALAGVCALLCLILSLVSGQAAALLPMFLLMAGATLLSWVGPLCFRP